MFGLSTTEIIIILAVALIVLGPQQLPKLAAQLGKGVRDLQRAANDFKREVTTAAEQSVERPAAPPSKIPPPYPPPAEVTSEAAAGDVAAEIEYEPPGHDGYPEEPGEAPPRASAPPQPVAARIRPAPSAQPYGELAAMAKPAAAGEPTAEGSGPAVTPSAETANAPPRPEVLL